MFETRSGHATSYGIQSIVITTQLCTICSQCNLGYSLLHSLPLTERCVSVSNCTWMMLNLKLSWLSVPQLCIYAQGYLVVLRSFWESLAGNIPYHCNEKVSLFKTCLFLFNYVLPYVIFSLILGTFTLKEAPQLGLTPKKMCTIAKVISFKSILQPNYSLCKTSIIAPSPLLSFPPFTDQVTFWGGAALLSPSPSVCHRVKSPSSYCSAPWETQAV